MRHQYTPVFREFTTSSMWAAPAATRCVWLWMLLNADPEGFVPGTVPGLAVAANVTAEEARSAVAMFLDPDPDSNTQTAEGRRIEKVPHGWRILNFTYWRELAKREAEKARKRKWADANRKRPPAANDNAEPEPAYSRLPVDASSETVDAPKPKPKPKPKHLSEERSSPTPPPVLDIRDTDPTWRDPPDVFDAPTLPTVIHKLSEWRPKEGELDGLRNASVMAGVRDFDGWMKKLGAGPVGGSRGLLPDMVGDYIQAQFGRWRTWEETDDFKAANSRAAAASPRSFQGARLPSVPFEPEAKHEAFARRLGIDLNAIVKGVLDDYPQPSGTVSRVSILGERLTIAAKQKAAGHPVTGKLTRAENQAWGPPPAGGSIPDLPAEASA